MTESDTEPDSEPGTVGLTAAHLLDTDHTAEPDEELREAVRSQADSSALSAIPAAVLALLPRQIRYLSGPFLQFDLGEVIVSSWRLHRAFTAAAQATSANHDSIELVLPVVAANAIYRPTVDVFVGEPKVGTFKLELEVNLRTDSLVATVAQGRVVRLEGGICTATGMLRLWGRQILSGTKSINLPTRLALGDGILL